jgi:hypothetical protein
LGSRKDWTEKATEVILCFRGYGVWKLIITRIGLALGITIATTMTVSAQPVVAGCKPGTIAVLDIPQSPISWILFPIFGVGITIILCGFAAAMIGIISLFFKSPRPQSAAEAAKLQERFFFDPTFRANRLLIGWGFSSFATMTLLLFLLGIFFGQRC